MKNLLSIDRLAGLSARQAQSQTAMIRRDIRALRDSVTGLSRGIYAPRIGTRRHVIKGSTSGSNLSGFAGIGMAALIDTGIFGDTTISAGGSVKIGKGTYAYSASSMAGNGDSGNGGKSGGGDCCCGDDSGSFYTSDAQSAGQSSDALRASQRVR